MSEDWCRAVSRLKHFNDDAAALEVLRRPSVERVLTVFCQDDETDEHRKTSRSLPRPVKSVTHLMLEEVEAKTT